MRCCFGWPLSRPPAQRQTSCSSTPTSRITNDVRNSPHALPTVESSTVVGACFSNPVEAWDISARAPVKPWPTRLFHLLSTLAEVNKLLAAGCWFFGRDGKTATLIAALPAFAPDEQHGLLPWSSIIVTARDYGSTACATACGGPISLVIPGSGSYPNEVPSHLRLPVPYEHLCRLRSHGQLGAGMGPCHLAEVPVLVNGEAVGALVTVKRLADEATRTPGSEDSGATGAMSLETLSACVQCLAKEVFGSADGFEYADKVCSMVNAVAMAPSNAAVASILHDAAPQLQELLLLEHVGHHFQAQPQSQQAPCPEASQRLVQLRLHVTLGLLSLAESSVSSTTGPACRKPGACYGSRTNNGGGTATEGDSVASVAADSSDPLLARGPQQQLLQLQLFCGPQASAPDHELSTQPVTLPAHETLVPLLLQARRRVPAAAATAVTAATATYREEQHHEQLRELLDHPAALVLQHPEQQLAPPQRRAADLQALETADPAHGCSPGGSLVLVACPLSSIRCKSSTCSNSSDNSACALVAYVVCSAANATLHGEKQSPSDADLSSLAAHVGSLLQLLVGALEERRSATASASIPNAAQPAASADATFNLPATDCLGQIKVRMGRTGSSREARCDGSDGRGYGGIGACDGSSGRRGCCIDSSGAAGEMCVLDISATGLLAACRRELHQVQQEQHHMGSLAANLAEADSGDNGMGFWERPGGMNLCSDSIPTPGLVPGSAISGTGSVLLFGGSDAAADSTPAATAAAADVPASILGTAIPVARNDDSTVRAIAVSGGNGSGGNSSGGGVATAAAAAAAVRSMLGRSVGRAAGARAGPMTPCTASVAGTGSSSALFFGGTTASSVTGTAANSALLGGSAAASILGNSSCSNSVALGMAAAVTAAPATVGRSLMLGAGWGQSSHGLGPGTEVNGSMGAELAQDVGLAALGAVSPLTMVTAVAEAETEARAGVVSAICGSSIDIDGDVSVSEGGTELMTTACSELEELRDAIEAQPGPGPSLCPRASFPFQPDSPCATATATAASPTTLSAATNNDFTTTCSNAIISGVNALSGGANSGVGGVCSSRGMGSGCLPSGAYEGSGRRSLLATTYKGSGCGSLPDTGGVSGRGSCTDGSTFQKVTMAEGEPPADAFTSIAAAAAILPHGDCGDSRTPLSHGSGSVASGEPVRVVGAACRGHAVAKEAAAECGHCDSRVSAVLSGNAGSGVAGSNISGHGSSLLPTPESAPARGPAPVPAAVTTRGGASRLRPMRVLSLGQAAQQLQRAPITHMAPAISTTAGTSSVPTTPSSVAAAGIMVAAAAADLTDCRPVTVPMAQTPPHVLPLGQHALASSYCSSTGRADSAAGVPCRDGDGEEAVRRAEQGHASGAVECLLMPGPPAVSRNSSSCKTEFPEAPVEPPHHGGQPPYKPRRLDRMYLPLSLHSGPRSGAVAVAAAAAAMVHASVPGQAPAALATAASAAAASLSIPLPLQPPPREPVSPSMEAGASCQPAADSANYAAELPRFPPHRPPTPSHATAPSPPPPQPPLTSLTADTATATPPSAAAIPSASSSSASTTATASSTLASCARERAGRQLADYAIPEEVPQDYTVAETVAMMRVLAQARGAHLSSRLRRVRVTAKIQSAHPEELPPDLPSRLARAAAAATRATAGSERCGGGGGGGGAWILTGIAARRGCIELVFDMVQVDALGEGEGTRAMERPATRFGGGTEALGPVIGYHGCGGDAPGMAAAMGAATKLQQQRQLQGPDSLPGQCILGPEEVGHLLQQCGLLSATRDPWVEVQVGDTAAGAVTLLPRAGAPVIADGVAAKGSVADGPRVRWVVADAEASCGMSGSEGATAVDDIVMVAAAAGAAKAAPVEAPTLWMPCPVALLTHGSQSLREIRVVAFGDGAFCAAPSLPVASLPRHGIGSDEVLVRGAGGYLPSRITAQLQMPLPLSPHQLPVDATCTTAVPSAAGAPEHLTPRSMAALLLGGIGTDASFGAEIAAALKSSHASAVGSGSCSSSSSGGDVGGKGCCVRLLDVVTEPVMPIACTRGGLLLLECRRTVGCISGGREGGHGEATTIPAAADAATRTGLPPGRAAAAVTSVPVPLVVLTEQHTDAFHELLGLRHRMSRILVSEASPSTLSESVAAHIEMACQQFLLDLGTLLDAAAATAATVAPDTASCAGTAAAAAGDPGCELSGAGAAGGGCGLLCRFEADMQDLVRRQLQQDCRGCGSACDSGRGDEGRKEGDVSDGDWSGCAGEGEGNSSASISSSRGFGSVYKQYMLDLACTVLAGCVAADMPYTARLVLQCACRDLALSAPEDLLAEVEWGSDPRVTAESLLADFVNFDLGAGLSRDQYEDSEQRLGVDSSTRMQAQSQRVQQQLQELSGSSAAAACGVPSQLSPALINESHDGRASGDLISPDKEGRTCGGGCGGSGDGYKAAEAFGTRTNATPLVICPLPASPALTEHPGHQGRSPRLFPSSLSLASLSLHFADPAMEAEYWRFVAGRARGMIWSYFLCVTLITTVSCARAWLEDGPSGALTLLLFSGGQAAVMGCYCLAVMKRWRASSCTPTSTPRTTAAENTGATTDHVSSASAGTFSSLGQRLPQVEGKDTTTASTFTAVATGATLPGSSGPAAAAAAAAAVKSAKADAADGDTGAAASPAAVAEGAAAPATAIAVTGCVNVVSASLGPPASGVPILASHSTPVPPPPPTGQLPGPPSASALPAAAAAAAILPPPGALFAACVCSKLVRVVAVALMGCGALRVPALMEPMAVRGVELVAEALLRPMVERVPLPLFLLLLLVELPAVLLLYRHYQTIYPTFLLRNHPASRTLLYSVLTVAVHLSTELFWRREFRRWRNASTGASSEGGYGGRGDGSGSGASSSGSGHRSLVETAGAASAVGDSHNGHGRGGIGGGNIDDGSGGRNDKPGCGGGLKGTVESII